MLFMTNKITKKEFFGMLEMVVESSNVANKEELKAFVKREIELLNKKAESRKAGTTKKAKENNAITELILAELEKVGKTTITNLLKESQVLADYICEDGKCLSNQRISALLKPLYVGENPVVERTVEKKNVYFKVIE